MEYKSIINELYQRRTKGIKLGVERIFSVLDKLGNPQQYFKSVHIAGTNGKGSVSKMIYELLKAHGFSVGLFTSPHLTRFTERVVVDNEEITEREVVELIKYLKPFCEDLTFFEYVTVMAFVYFKEKRVDYAVLETGMGGRLDATNVVMPEASVITSIGMDHQEFLGNDLLSIASEKAGIIKRGIPVVCSSQKPQVENLLRQKAENFQSQFYIYGKDFFSQLNSISLDGIDFNFSFSSDSIRVFLPLTGLYQLENASVALKTFMVVYPDWNLESVTKGFKNVKMPGRMEILSKNPLIILDIAHNLQAAEALIASLKRLTDKRPMVVFGSMRDKDFMGFIRLFNDYAKTVFFTAPKYERALQPQEFLAQINGDFKFPVYCISDSKQAFKEALKTVKKDSSLYLLCTGSAYLVGEIKELLGERALHKGLGELL